MAPGAGAAARRLLPGIDEVRRNIFDPLDAEWWDEFTAEPDEFLDAGTEIVVLGRYRGIAKQTGKKLDVPFVHVWSVREGKAVRFRQFLDTAGWVAALDPLGAGPAPPLPGDSVEPTSLLTQLIIDTRLRGVEDRPSAAARGEQSTVAHV